VDIHRFEVDNQGSQLEVVVVVVVVVAVDMVVAVVGVDIHQFDQDMVVDQL
jgi:hypothetical protein